MNPGRFGFGIALYGKSQMLCTQADLVLAQLCWEKSQMLIVTNPGRFGFGTALCGESQML